MSLQTRTVDYLANSATNADYLFTSTQRPSQVVSCFLQSHGDFSLLQYNDILPVANRLVTLTSLFLIHSLFQQVISIEVYITLFRLLWKSCVCFDPFCVSQTTK